MGPGPGQTARLVPAKSNVLSQARQEDTHKLPENPGTNSQKLWSCLQEEEKFAKEKGSPGRRHSLVNGDMEMGRSLGKVSGEEGVGQVGSSQSGGMPERDLAGSRSRAQPGVARTNLPSRCLLHQGVGAGSLWQNSRQG